MYVNGNVRYLIKDDEIYLYGMFSGKVREIKLEDRPYFFIRKNCWREVKDSKCVVEISDVDLMYRDKDFSEHSVVEVKVRKPADVSMLREYLDRVGSDSFEADVPFVRRLEVDKKITVRYSRDNVVYLDIEVDDSKGFPGEYGRYRIECIGVMTENEEEWFYVGNFSNEREMLEEFMDWISGNNKTVIAGWNVGFDYNHLVGRMDELGIVQQHLKFCEIVDLKGMYEGVVKGLSSYSLSAVSEYEGWRKKGRDKRISLMTEDELRRYNMYDVELLRLLDDRYGFLSLTMELANFLNLNVSNLSPLRIGDTLVLRRLRELGYVGRNSSRNEDENSVYKGAYVMTPVPGIHENVVVMDFNAMYPSIIINEKIDIDGFSGEVLPYVVSMIKDERFRFKKMYKETGEKRYDILQKMMKPVLNSLYGIMGLTSFRYYNKDKAEMITRKGKVLISSVADFVNDVFGLRCVYGDTDSVFVEVGNKVKDVISFSKFMVSVVNSEVSPYEMDVDKIFKKVLFLCDDNGEGIKKRYVGITVDGDYVWRGLETRRGDVCELAKEVLRNVVKMLLEEEASITEVFKYLNDVKTKMMKGEYDDKLVITKGVKNNVDEYVANTPQKRALVKARKKGYGCEVSGKISYVWCNGDVEPIVMSDDLDKLRGRLDYKYYWNNQIYPPVDRILKSISVGKQLRLF